MLATHPTVPALNIELVRAREVVAGTVDNWRDLGAAPAPLRLTNLASENQPGSVDAAAQALLEVSRDPQALAVVPASAVAPPVRVVSVDGTHPLRQPSEYPLTTLGVSPPPVSTATFVGDIMLGRRVGASLARSRDFVRPLRPLAQRLNSADVTVGNLESTLSRAGSPRQGGDSFAADPRVLRGLRAAGFDVLSLANNHTGDFGPRALVETVRRVDAAGIVGVGAGGNAQRAAVRGIVERAGIRFGFLAFNAIAETPRAGRRTPGAVSLRMPPRTGNEISQSELDAVIGAVQRLRSQVDVLVVLPHWGQQYTYRPVPAQRTVARVLVEAGADLVVGAHPHWVQGVEVHDDSVVVHSLGNFVFDMDFSRQTQEGVILEATFWGNRLKAVEFQPVRIGSDFAPRLLRGAAAQRVLDAMWDYSRAPFNGRG